MRIMLLQQMNKEGENLGGLYLDYEKIEGFYSEKVNDEKRMYDCIVVMDSGKEYRLAFSISEFIDLLNHERNLDEEKERERETQT